MTIKSSLKATKKAIKSPSKGEVILSDSDIIKLAPITLLFANSYQFGIEHEKLVLAKGESENNSAQSFVNYVKDNKLSYQSMLAVKKHLIESIAKAKKQATKTIELWLNKIIKAYLSNADLKGFELPKAESKSAESMAKKRAEFAKIADSELQAQIETSARAGDFKKAAQLSTEKAKREKQAQNAIKQSESKATTELKTMLKKWVSSMDSNELMALVYAKNNFGEIAKLAKSTN